MKNGKKDRKVCAAYLEKRSYYPILLQDKVDPEVSMIVVVPSYREDGLYDMLNSLEDCDTAGLGIEIIVVLNSGEHDSDEVRDLHKDQYEFIKNSSWPLPVHPILIENVPHKRAGVGHARKTGMDEALRRLSQHHLEDGIIICLDADCRVKPNYFRVIHDHFRSPYALQAAHLYFEHRLPPESNTRSAIIDYEIHLRLMKLQIAESGHPQGYHAVGSCLVVKALGYARQGGMNARKAGEDFYFIHKFSRIRELSEITDTTVYPASRSSSRVPFGTGAAVKKTLAGGQQMTYAGESYAELKQFCLSIPNLYEGDTHGLTLLHGFKEEEAGRKIEEAMRHTTNLDGFVRRFFGWFDAFQVVKYLHHLRDTKFPNLPIQRAAEQYIQAQHERDISDVEDQLIFLRRLEKP